MAKFTAAVARGEGLSAASRAEPARPQVRTTTAHQFPILAEPLPAAAQPKALFAGLGDHRKYLRVPNDVRAEAAFASLVKFILGVTGVPYDWEYGDRAGKS